MNATPDSSPWPVIYHEYFHFFLSNNFDDIPLWFGELGGISLGVDGRRGDFSYRDAAGPAELVEGYRRVVEQVPREAAGFVWTQLADVEGELNGLLTAERKPKAPFDDIRVVNERFLHG